MVFSLISCGKSYCRGEGGQFPLINILYAGVGIRNWSAMPRRKSDYGLKFHFGSVGMLACWFKFDI